MKKFIRKEVLYGARNYNPINVCIKEAKGIYLTDVNSKKYMDFISAYSAVNQGHCHPRLLKVLHEQSHKLTLTSRAIYNDILGDYMEKICSTFGYENVLPMNTGVEGGETAIKISRAWGYKKKGIEPNKAVNLFCQNNFWGRTLAAVSSSTDKECYQNFGPYMNGFKIIQYNNIEIFEKTLQENSNIVSIMLEPIQGEAGIIIPDENYLPKIRELCNKYNVLLIADEVQTGMGRTGKMLACDYANIKPDILILGKALSGGIMPISAVLADKDIMEVIEPGTHGSTFGGNPLASAIAMEAINIIEDEQLISNSFIQGEYLRENIDGFDNDHIKHCRGKGLLNALEFKNTKTANIFTENLRKNGILAKSTHDNIIRLSPPLTITRSQIDRSLEIIKKSLDTI